MKLFANAPTRTVLLTLEARSAYLRFQLTPTDGNLRRLRKALRAALAAANRIDSDQGRAVRNNLWTAATDADGAAGFRDIEPLRHACIASVAECTRNAVLCAYGLNGARI